MPTGYRAVPPDPVRERHVQSVGHFDRLLSCFFFDVRNMKELFDPVTHSTILLYVRAIGLFFKM